MADLLGIVALIAILAIPLASLVVAFQGNARRWVFLQCGFVIAAFGLLNLQQPGRGVFALIIFLIPLYLVVLVLSAAAGLLGRHFRQQAQSKSSDSEKSIA